MPAKKKSTYKSSQPRTKKARVSKPKKPQFSQKELAHFVKLRRESRDTSSEQE